MKLLQYLNYFFYIGINWSWKTASITIKQEIKGEQKYGINTTGADELKKLKSAGIDTSHSTIYMPVSYGVIETALNQLTDSGKSHFLDIGCGKGRAMAVAAHYGYRNISGIDISPIFCKQAIQNLNLVKEKIQDFNFSVLTADAKNYIIPDQVDCIFIFNPFDQYIMEIVQRNICISLARKPRGLDIIYANPLYKNLFLQNKFKEIFYNKSYEYFEVSILSFRH